MRVGVVKIGSVARRVAVANVAVFAVALGFVAVHNNSHHVSLDVSLSQSALGSGRVSFAPPAAAQMPGSSGASAAGGAAAASGSIYNPGPRVPDPPVPTSVTLAQPEGTIPTYTDAGGTQNGTIGSWYGYPLVLPVTMVEGDWLQIRRPERPNGSITWIKAEDAFVSTSPYWMQLDVGPETLHVFKAGQEILRFPVGVGTPRTPTPTGNFFVAVHEASSGYEYGPLILDTSAHSEAIQSWDGRGDAIIAIHGPIDSYADSRIGSGAARVSNGCIRMHNSDLAQLAVIPTGTPLDIYA